MDHIARELERMTLEKKEKLTAYQTKVSLLAFSRQCLDSAHDMM